MTISEVLRLVACPPSKLDNKFPWTLQEATKKYLKSLVSFAVGSFSVPLLLLGFVLGLCQYPNLMSVFMDRNWTAVVVMAIFATGAAFSASAYAIQNWRRGRKMNFDRYAWLVSITIIGGLFFTLTTLLGMHLLFPNFKPVINAVANAMSDSSGNPNMSFVMSLSTVAFVLGFGMQMRSIAKSLKQAGTSLTEFMALNIDKRRGRKWWITALKIILPAVAAALLWYPIEQSVIYLLGPCEQPTTKMAREATGGNFLLFALMAAIGAPIFEEMVFRGFLFQVIRGSLKGVLAAPKLVAIPESGFGRAWALADNWVRTSSFAMQSWFHRILGGRRTELTAVLLSSFMFAVLHMQFQPTALVLLFLLGCVHAEVYRRTGSLYCSMLLHAINNGLAVILIAMGH